MSTVFYIIKVELDDNDQVIDGSEEAVGLLTHPVVIDQAITELNKKKERELTSKVNCAIPKIIN